MTRILAILAVFCITGCGGTPDFPPCGPGTYEFQGICLPTETDPPCGQRTIEVHGVCLPNDGNNHAAFCAPGTHWDANSCDGNICGMCVANPLPTSTPVKQLICGKGTHEQNGECAPDNSSVEVCDGKDNNGDGQIDESDPNEGRYCEKLVSLIVGGVNKIVPTRGQLVCMHWPDGQGLLCDPNYQSVETCNNHVDDNGNGLVDEGCNTLSVSASPYTPASQTLVMGSTGVELMQFMLTFNTTEAVTLNTVTIVDDGDSKAFGALEYLHLMNGSTEYANWPVLAVDNKVASVIFGGMKINWAKGSYTVSLSVKADVTTWDDGGSISSHRLRVTGATATTKSGAKVEVNISTGANEPTGNWMMIARAKFSVAWSADTPSGVAAPSAEQVIAKFDVTNGANVGNYSVWIDYMQVGIGTIGIKLGPQNILRLYRDSFSAANLLGSFTFGANATNYSYNVASVNLPHLEIASGTTRKIIATLNTAVANLASSGNAISVQLPPESIFWTDGVGKYGGLVDSLPLPPKTITFP